MATTTNQSIGSRASSAGWRRWAQWIAGVLWFLAWFELYLEIFRHHHVSPRLLGEPPLDATIGPGARPGTWLRTVQACSALAPILFVGLVLFNRFVRGPAFASVRDTSDPHFPFALAVAAFGAMLATLGGINQVIQRSPIAVDLTLRSGNGGFIVLGLVLVVVGAILGRGPIGGKPAERGGW